MHDCLPICPYSLDWRNRATEYQRNEVLRIGNQGLAKVMKVVNLFWGERCWGNCLHIARFRPARQVWSWLISRLRAGFFVPREEQKAELNYWRYKWGLSNARHIFFVISSESETISVISISLLLPIWSTWSSEVNSGLSYLFTLPQILPTHALILLPDLSHAVFDSVSLILLLFSSSF